MKLYAIFCLWKGIQKPQCVFEDGGDFWLGGGSKMKVLLFTSRKSAEGKAREVKKRWKELGTLQDTTIVVKRAEIMPLPTG